MSSTNKTPNYNLSQFADSDKPTWRGDYNADMSKIDTSVKDVCIQTQAVAAIANEAKTDVQQLTTKVTGVETTANSALTLAQTNETDIATNETAFDQYKTTVSTQFSQLGTRISQLNQSLTSLTDLVDTKLTAPPDGYQSGAHMEMHFTQASWTNTFTPNGTPIYVPFDDPTGNAVGKWATKKQPGVVEIKPGTYLFVGKSRVNNIQSGQHSFSVGFELNTDGKWFSSSVLSAETYSYDLASSAPPAEGLVSAVFEIGQTAQIRFGLKARGSGSNFTAVIGDTHVQVIRLNEGTGAARDMALFHAVDDMVGQPDM